MKGGGRYEARRVLGVKRAGERRRTEDWEQLKKKE